MQCSAAARLRSEHVPLHTAARPQPVRAAVGANAQAEGGAVEAAEAVDDKQAGARVCSCLWVKWPQSS